MSSKKLNIYLFFQHN